MTRRVHLRPRRKKPPARQIERDIRNRLASLRKAIRSGNDSELVVWAIDGQLACAQRPLRDDPPFGGRGPLPPEARDAVVKWVERIVNLGFRSIICLAHHKELRYYEPLALHPDGLIGFYEASGLVVRHLPSLDPAHAATLEERAQRMAQVEQIKAEARSAFEQLPKPVLLHCSAGIDRSPPVATFIATTREP